VGPDFMEYWKAYSLAEALLEFLESLKVKNLCEKLLKGQVPYGGRKPPGRRDRAKRILALELCFVTLVTTT
jgi:hypothetical protein